MYWNQEESERERDSDGGERCLDGRAGVWPEGWAVGRSDERVRLVKMHFVICMCVTLARARVCVCVCVLLFSCDRMWRVISTLMCVCLYGACVDSILDGVCIYLCLYILYEYIYIRGCGSDDMIETHTLNAFAIVTHTNTTRNFLYIKAMHIHFDSIECIPPILNSLHNFRICVQDAISSDMCVRAACAGIFCCCCFAICVFSLSLSVPLNVHWSWVAINECERDTEKKTVRDGIREEKTRWMKIKAKWSIVIMIENRLMKNRKFEKTWNAWNNTKYLFAMAIRAIETPRLIGEKVVAWPWIFDSTHSDCSF